MLFTSPPHSTPDEGPPADINLLEERYSEPFVKAFCESKIGDRVGEAARICNATLPLRERGVGGVLMLRQGYVGCIVQVALARYVRVNMRGGKYVMH